MKELIRKNLPTVFSVCKKIYQKSFLHKIKDKKEKLRYDEWQKKRLSEDLIILKEVFNDDCIVFNGPFKGMLYIKQSSGSAFLPKILGSYEEPIHEWIEKAIGKKYKTIIDVGCAEGYYTVGFAMRLPTSKVVAFDIDNEALKNAIELIKLNGLENVQLRKECTYHELNELCTERSLVFCDIEGFEKILLNPLKVPNLKYADLIIECHDFLIENVTADLISRFVNSHKITIIIDYCTRIKDYETPTKVDKVLFDRIANEYRQPATKFMLLECF
jgi:tRNA G46 methylase TrmB